MPKHKKCPKCKHLKLGHLRTTTCPKSKVRISSVSKKNFRSKKIQEGFSQHEIEKGITYLRNNKGIHIAKINLEDWEPQATPFSMKTLGEIGKTTRFLSTEIVLGKNIQASLRV